MKKNILFNVIYQFIYIVTQLFVISYTAKVLGASGVGEFTLALTYANYAILLAGLGIDKYAVREIAYNQNQHTIIGVLFKEILVLRLITFCVISIVYLLLFWGVNINNSLSIKFNIILIVSSAIDISWLFMGLEDMKSIVIKNTVIRIITVILLYIFVKSESDVAKCSLLLAISAAVGQSLLWLNMPVFIKESLWKIKGKISLGHLFNHLKGSFELFIPNLAIQIYVMLDKVILGNICGNYELGLYENACKLVDVTRVVQAAVIATTPTMSFLWAQKKLDKYKANIYSTYKNINFFVFPLCLGLMAISSNLVPWFLGDDFISIVPMMYLSSLFILTKSWSSILGDQVLMSSSNQSYYTVAVTVGALVDIVLNILLIKKFKAFGVLFASIVAEYIGMFIMLWAVYKLIGVSVKTLYTGVRKYLIISILMGLIVYYTGLIFNPSFAVTIIQILIGGLFYLVAMVMTKDKMVISFYKVIREKLRGNEFD